MKNSLLLTIVFIFITTAGAWWFFSANPDTPASTFEECVAAGKPVMESYPRQCRADGQIFTESIGNEFEKAGLIRISTPRPNQTISSPLTIAGEAHGTWYFEASFPVKLYDANNKLLAQVPAQAQGDWMTTEYVPFVAALTFSVPETATGTLVLEKDNPSGLPEHADQLEVPVIFASSSVAVGTRIKLYYYNPALDQGPGGAQCSKNGLVAVDRVIPKTTTPLTETVRLLLQGELSSSERAQGLTTEFPLSDVTLTSATIRNRVATLTFNDPQNKTSGGSCRVAVLWAQIEATAKQFSTVNTVHSLPADLFQP